MKLLGRAPVGTGPVLHRRKRIWSPRRRDHVRGPVFPAKPCSKDWRAASLLRSSGQSIPYRSLERWQAAFLLHTDGWRHRDGGASGRKESEPSAGSRRNAPDQHHRISKEFGCPCGIAESLISSPDRI